LPDHRITVNLAPADLRKEGPVYDLPIAVGIVVASQQIWPALESYVLPSKLSLDGTLRHTPGVLPMISVALAQGCPRAFVPTDYAPTSRKSPNGISLGSTEPRRHMPHVPGSLASWPRSVWD
jgi:predicted ATPase with chaperone activity